MKKQELITTIMGLYDTIQNQDNQIKFLLGETPKDKFNEKFLEYGKKHIFNTSTFAINMINVDETEEGLKYTSFEDWKKRIIVQIPDFMSKNEFYKYFNKELLELYETQLNERKNQYKAVASNE